MSKFSRMACFILSLLLLMASAPGLAAQGEQLQQGDSGAAVLNLKFRLFDLGYYFTAKNFDKRYTKDTAAKVTAFQALNGLEQTGVADSATLEAVYGADAVKAPLPEKRPTYDISPDSLPDTVLADAPAPGSIKAGGAPYVYKDREAGYWYYLSDRMEVSITRFYQAKGQLEWFEVYIKYLNGGQPFTQESQRNGKAHESPIKLAQDAGAVVAINDDYFRYRESNNQRVGVIVRDGKEISNRTYPQDRSRIPSLEVMALFPDGTMKTFASDAHTAQEYIDMGVTDTWAFGPALVQEGEVPRYFYSKDYRSYREPRCAIGMIRPGEYCALVITGRKTGSKGATFGWMAEKMLAMGATEALNLDGGGTTALVFDGELLNHSLANQRSRAVTGMIVFK